MGGVAHTSGSDTVKEIHFSCQHIVNCANRCADEIRGVLVHEVVHCFQYNDQNTCPGGLIEGVAGNITFSPLPTLNFELNISPHAPQTGFAFVPVLTPHIGVLVGTSGTQDIMSRPTFCNG